MQIVKETAQVGCKTDSLKAKRTRVSKVGGKRRTRENAVRTWKIVITTFENKNKKDFEYYTSYIWRVIKFYLLTY